MEYIIKRIESKDQIEMCNKFDIKNYMWDNVVTPKAYGQVGYLKGEGFYVYMTCEETDPQRIYKNYTEPVYKDSALEAFLAFPEKGEVFNNDIMYTNFEVNANAAMYIAYGKGRQGRKFMPENYLEKVACKGKIEEDKWSVSFLIPEQFLCEECGVGVIDNDTEIYCNFYTISESKEIEHYGSFTKIDSETPNFHLPVCFAKAIIEKERV